MSILSITVLLRMDKTTVVAYVNKLGGEVYPKLNTIVRELWLWCMNRDITLVAEHLPGILNTTAYDNNLHRSGMCIFQEY